ncbi:MAG: ABC transporter ATP-binding protein [Chloroflexi bacterium]|nr:ABC transporter ATP-binding protein [Chloroflexota bacterium]MBI4505811.1 ABC transporter ATP-binding protein [Chloroflexota bacterium]
MSALLEVAGLEVAYGAVRAVKGVDLVLHAGEIRVILGANGAGKTSILKAIFGLVKPRAGRIAFQGQELRGLEPHEVGSRGVAWVPEGRQIWATLTVRQNLVMGAFVNNKRAAVERRMAELFDRFPILAERRSQLAGSLSGGEQQMLAIARALMAEPKLLLMDEPSLGLAPLIIRRVFDLVREINASGISILMVEQNARQSLRVANWAYLLENGAIAGSGSPAALASTEEIRRVYLGG